MICDPISERILLVDWFSLFPHPDLNEFAHVSTIMVLNQFQHLSYNMPECLIDGRWDEVEMSDYTTTLHRKTVEWLNSEVFTDLDLVHVLKEIYPKHSKLNRRLLDQVGAMIETCEPYIVSEIPVRLLSQVSMDYLSWSTFDKVDTGGKSILDFMSTFAPKAEVILVSTNKVLTRTNGVITERI